MRNDTATAAWRSRAAFAAVAKTARHRCRPSARSSSRRRLSDSTSSANRHRRREAQPSRGDTRPAAQRVALEAVGILAHHGPYCPHGSRRSRGNPSAARYEHRSPETARFSTKSSCPRNRLPSRYVVCSTPGPVDAIGDAVHAKSDLEASDERRHTDIDGKTPPGFGARAHDRASGVGSRGLIVSMTGAFVSSRNDASASS